jgi:AP2 domain
VTVEVPLDGTNAAGRVALVDDADWPLMARHSWHVVEGVLANPGHTPYGPYARNPDGVFMHTLITGAPRTDHRDGNGLNNQRANLRPATRASTSGYKGVTYDRQTGRWKAQIKVDYRNIHLGRHPTAEDAALAYDAAARELHGVFARLNFQSITPGPPSPRR